METRLYCKSFRPRREPRSASRGSPLPGSMQMPDRSDRRGAGAPRRGAGLFVSSTLPPREQPPKAALIFTGAFRGTEFATAKATTKPIPARALSGWPENSRPCSLSLRVAHRPAAEPLWMKIQRRLAVIARSRLATRQSDPQYVSLQIAASPSGSSQ
jgi:hypothetical protein